MQYTNLAEYAYHSSFPAQINAIMDLLSKATPEEVIPYNDEQKRYMFYQETGFWFNGREKGYTLTFTDCRSFNKYLHIVFCEGRNHDGIVIYYWITNDPKMNPVTIHDWNEEVYRNSTGRSYMDIVGAVDVIKDLVKLFFATEYDVLVSDHKWISNPKKD